MTCAKHMVYDRYVQTGRPGWGCTCFASGSGIWKCALVLCGTCAWLCDGVCCVVQRCGAMLRVCCCWCVGKWRKAEELVAVRGACGW